MASSDAKVPTCPICLESVWNGCQTHCRHHFDADCLNPWLHQNARRPTCPVCRELIWPSSIDFDCAYVVFLWMRPGNATGGRADSRAEVACIGTGSAGSGSGSGDADISTNTESQGRDDSSQVGFVSLAPALPIYDDNGNLVLDVNESDEEDDVVFFRYTPAHQVRHTRLVCRSRRARSANRARRPRRDS